MSYFLVFLQYDPTNGCSSGKFCVEGDGGKVQKSQTEEHSVWFRF
jgi:hypothetical protein